MALELITTYKGFSIYDNRAADTITSFPISVYYAGMHVATYRSVVDAKAEIDQQPDWLEDLKDRATAHRR